MREIVGLGSGRESPQHIVGPLLCVGRYGGRAYGSDLALRDGVVRGRAKVDAAKAAEGVASLTSAGSGTYQTSRSSWPSRRRWAPPWRST